VGLALIAGGGGSGTGSQASAAGGVPSIRAGSGAAIALLGALGRASSTFARLREAASRSTRPRDWSRRRVQAAVVGAVLVFLVAPSLFVIPVSFTNSTFLDFPPRGFTLRWYGEFFRSPIWVSATVRSLYVAVAVAVLATVLGVSAAFGLSRRKFAGQKWVMGLVLAPMILPRMIIAVGLFYLLARMELVGTDLALIIGHTVLAFPFVVVTMLAMLKNYDPQFDRAAMTLGASPARTFFHVTLPLISAGVVAAAIFAFMTSFDDLNLALFLAGGEQNTLPKQMWSTMILQANPLLGAASTMLLILMTSFAFAAEMLSRRNRTRSLRGSQAAAGQTA
jgi:putative spermidine/putrescine transport system permease protein